MPDNARFVRQFEKLSSHPLIEKIQMEKEYLIITTKDITYHNARKNNKLPDFVLGAYYLFIPFNSSSKPRAINFKRQAYKGHHFHPCVKREGVMCLGSTVSDGVASYQRSSNYIELVYLLISFLKEPNYVGPYMPDYQFCNALQ